MRVDRMILIPLTKLQQTYVREVVMSTYVTNKKVYVITFWNDYYIEIGEPFNTVVVEDENDAYDYFKQISSFDHRYIDYSYIMGHVKDE